MNSCIFILVLTSARSPLEGKKSIYPTRAAMHSHRHKKTDAFIPRPRANLQKHERVSY